MSDPEQDASEQQPPTHRPESERLRRRIRALAAVAVISALIAAVSYFQANRPEEIVFEGFDGGDSLQVSSLKGEPVLINFFASWCIPCRKEMPLLEQAHQRYGDQVVFIGVDLRDNPSQAKALIAETKVTYRIVADPDGTAYGALVAQADSPTRIAMPFTAFVDRRGDVVHTHAGLLTGDALEELIRKHLL